MIELQGKYNAAKVEKEAVSQIIKTVLLDDNHVELQSWIKSFMRIFRQVLKSGRNHIRS